MDLRWGWTGRPLYGWIDPALMVPTRMSLPGTTQWLEVRDPFSYRGITPDYC